MPRKTTMAFGEAVRIAVSSLWAHKMRSVLTLLGVVIGVTSVIAVVSIITGLNTYVAEKVFNLGADVFLINRGPSIITNMKEYEETQKRRKFKLGDFKAVLSACKDCRNVGAALRHENGQVKYGMNYLTNVAIRGWTPSMAIIYDIDLASGRHINEIDVQQASPVCTVGEDIVSNLMPGVDPLGKELHVENEDCTIIGVGQKQGSVLGQSRDDWVIIPITNYIKMYGTNDSVVIWIKAYSTATLDRTMDEVRLILRGRRHVAYSDDDDFVMEDNASFLSLWGSISGAFFGVVVVIASISLIVGGIVIMNIMLVSVTERTREIGLRKSIGARSNDILLQFLIESSTIAAIGGLWGVLFGIMLAKLVSLLTSLPSVVELWSVIAGLIVATSVGVFFGVYPASKAARLDPVVALRSE
ncbi:MAG TPA: ABC transporter permease [Candidatus Acidoferrales bacterium]|nr:ABC transporter permease [Candidatus Acidoferrales bacterium]